MITVPLPVKDAVPSIVAPFVVTNDPLEMEILPPLITTPVPNINPGLVLDETVIVPPFIVVNPLPLIVSVFDDCTPPDIDHVATAVLVKVPANVDVVLESVMGFPAVLSDAVDAIDNAPDSVNPPPPAPPFTEIVPAQLLIGDEMVSVPLLKLSRYKSSNE